MSLVERALKKIQESRTQATAGAAVPELAPAMALQGSGTVPMAPISHRPEQTAPAIVRPSEPPRPIRIVHIDRDALRHSELLPAQRQERQLADEYRHIKRPLIANALGRGAPRLAKGQLIMLASALPGDGKTFTGINLALSMALEKDLSVVLVDADVAKPHVSRIFGVTEEVGLLDLLREGRSDVESVILPTDIAGLSLLPAGKPSDTATELLASARMESIVAQLAARDPNRIVLFDSSPLLLTSESRVLAGIVGQILLVVRAGVTPQQAVYDAIELLGEGKSVGLVLNQADEQSRAGYYHYYGDSGSSRGEDGRSDRSGAPS